MWARAGKRAAAGQAAGRCAAEGGGAARCAALAGLRVAHAEAVAALDAAAGGGVVGSAAKVADVAVAALDGAAGGVAAAGSAAKVGGGEGVDVRVAGQQLVRGVVLPGVEGEDGDEEEEEQLEGARDAVDDIVLHPLEDAARNHDRVDDDRQARLGEDEVGRRARRVGRALHRDAHVGLLERRRIVHTVPRHADPPPALP